MPKYKMTLEQYLSDQEDNIDACTIFKIIKGVLNALELVHQSGYTHNDIKTNNIMLDSS